jgi:alpha-glucosidase
MVKKEKCPVNVHISMNNSNKELTHFFNLEKFEEAKSGWYYNMATRAVLVKYDNPKQDYTLKVSFEVFDVVGM